jgi:energy-coupling factor transporter ATP-binding protein EcfA2
MKHELALFLKRLAAQNTAILLVTHDVELVAKVADRVAVMQSGHIVAQGKPYLVLRDHPEFSPQMMRLFPESGWLTVESVLHSLSLQLS